MTVIQEINKKKDMVSQLIRKYGFEDEKVIAFAESCEDFGIEIEEIEEDFKTLMEE